MRSLLPVLTLLAALDLSGSTASQARDVQVNLGASSSRVGSPRMVNNQGLWVTWVDYRNGLGDIYITRSPDAGVTWPGSAVRLDTDKPGAAQSITPQVARDSYTTVYVTWADSRNGRSDIYLNRTLYGKTWFASDVRLDTDRPGAAASTDPQIAASGSSVYVVWVDARNGRKDIYFNNSYDMGATWRTADVRIDTDKPGAADSDKVRLAVGSGYEINVVWEDTRNGRRDIYWNCSRDGGTTWLKSDVRIDTDVAGAADSVDPQISIAGFETFVTWADRRSGRFDIHVNRFDRIYRKWLATDMRVDSDSPGNADSVSPQIATYDLSTTWNSPRSYVCVTWSDSRNGQADIYCNRTWDSGKNWFGDVRLDTDTPGAARSFGPRITTTNALTCVTWVDARSGRTDIRFNRSFDSGRTWLASDMRLDSDSPGAANSIDPQILTSGTSTLVTWADERNFSPGSGNYDVFFNIPFGPRRYGTGTPGSSNYVPLLVVQGGIVGSTGANKGFVGFTFHNGLGGATGALVVGTPGSRISVPFLGGTLLVAPTLLLPFALGGSTGVPGAGWGGASVELPSDQALVGYHVNFQALFYDPGAVQGISMTNGVALWIG